MNETEVIHEITRELAYVGTIGSGTTEACAKRILKAIGWQPPSENEERTRQDERKWIGDWLKTNIMRTENRVTKLWVLGDLVKALEAGRRPGEG